MKLPEEREVVEFGIGMGTAIFMTRWVLIDLIAMGFDVIASAMRKKEEIKKKLQG